VITWVEPIPLASLGAVPLASAWVDSGCGAGPRARWLADGSIEVEGEGVPLRSLPKAVLQWKNEIQASAAKYGLPPQWIAGEMAAESGGQQRVHSWCCYGLMGLLPSTATSEAGHPVTASQLMDDPALNIDLGTKLLASLFQKYGGNPIKVPGAYNAGSPKCGAGKCDQPNRWNLVADCVDGKAVDYSSRVIGFSNSALLVGVGKGGGLGSTATSTLRLLAGVAVFGALGYALVRYAR
jgi:transglycosylase-like protein with SLT domain